MTTRLSTEISQSLKINHNLFERVVQGKTNIDAIHQHMTYEEPRIMFFHYWGRGTAKALVQAVKGGFLVGGAAWGQLTIAKLSVSFRLDGRLPCRSRCGA